METPKRYLCICSMGRNRSPTAVEVLYELAEERKTEVYAEHYGIRNKKHYMTSSRVESFDYVLVMDILTKWEVENACDIPEDRVVNLNVPDNYDVKIPTQRKNLRRILRRRLEKLMG